MALLSANFSSSSRLLCGGIASLRKPRAPPRRVRKNKIDKNPGGSIPAFHEADTIAKDVARTHNTVMSTGIRARDAGKVHTPHDGFTALFDLSFSKVGARRIKASKPRSALFTFFSQYFRDVKPYFQQATQGTASFLSFSSA